MTSRTRAFEPSTSAGRSGLAAILDDPAGTLLALDFDGTLAPIVDDPEHAVIHDGAVGALARLGPALGKLAIVTGRPVRSALRLGGFAGRRGLEGLSILGQYGVERWDAATGSTTEPPAPDGITDVDAELPALLADHGLEQARIEHKGRAIGVHTRTLDDPRAAFERLRDPIRALAARHGLGVEPGKNVWEMRAHGTDKGDAVRSLVAETGARQVVFVGDDLGDVPAFEAVRSLRADGGSGLLVYSHSAEEQALAELCDLEVAGPDEVAHWLGWLADRLGA